MDNKLKITIPVLLTEAERKQRRADKMMKKREETFQNSAESKSAAKFLERQNK